MKANKLFMSLGAISAIAIPVSAVIACGSSDKKASTSTSSSHTTKSTTKKTTTPTNKPTVTQPVGIDMATELAKIVDVESINNDEELTKELQSKKVGDVVLEDLLGYIQKTSLNQDTILEMKVKTIYANKKIEVDVTLTKEKETGPYKNNTKSITITAKKVTIADILAKIKTIVEDAAKDPSNAAKLLLKSSGIASEEIQEANTTQLSSLPPEIDEYNITNLPMAKIKAVVPKGATLEVTVRDEGNKYDSSKKSIISALEIEVTWPGHTTDISGKEKLEFGGTTFQFK